MAYDLKPLQRLAARRDRIDAERPRVVADLEEEMRKARAAGAALNDIAAAARVTRETARVATLPEAEREAWKTRRRKSAE